MSLLCRVTPGLDPNQIIHRLTDDQPFEYDTLLFLYLIKYVLQFS